MPAVSRHGRDDSTTACPCDDRRRRAPAREPDTVPNAAAGRRRIGPRRWSGRREARARRAGPKQPVVLFPGCAYEAQGWVRLYGAPALLHVRQLASGVEPDEAPSLNCSNLLPAPAGSATRWLRAPPPSARCADPPPAAGRRSGGRRVPATPSARDRRRPAAVRHPERHDRQARSLARQGAADRCGHRHPVAAPSTTCLQPATWSARSIGSASPRVTRRLQQRPATTAHSGRRNTQKISRMPASHCVVAASPPARACG